MSSIEFLRYFITTLVLLLATFISLFVYADKNPQLTRIWHYLRIVGTSMVVITLVGTLIAVWI
jgi:hypothetical protein